MKPPRLVLDDDGQPMVMRDEDVVEHLGKTFGVMGVRNLRWSDGQPKLYLPIRGVCATVELIAPALADFDPELVVQTYRGSKGEGIAQVTLGALLGLGT